MEGKHLGYLDGVRGVAALAVVFHHFATAFMPALVFGGAAVSHSWLEKYVYASPLNLFIGGNFAVCLFFILSGFVLTRKFFQTGNVEIIRSSATRRYVRLMPPILGSVLLAYLLLKLGLMRHQEIVAATGSTMWLAHQWSIVPQLEAALREGLWGAMLNGEMSYNSNLWTMQIEFLGSFLVFTFAALFGTLRHRWALYLVMIAVFWDTYYLGFLIGMMLSDASARGWIHASSPRNLLPWASLSMGIFLAAYPMGSVAGTPYEALHLGSLSNPQNFGFWHTLGAALVMTSIMLLPSLQRMFARPSAMFLGRVSFSLYLIHLLVLVTVSSWIFQLVIPHVTYLYAVAIVLEISIPLILVLSHFYTKALDEPSTAASGALWRWLNRPAGTAPTRTLPGLPYPAGALLRRAFLRTTEAPGEKVV